MRRNTKSVVYGAIFTALFIGSTLTLSVIPSTVYAWWKVEWYSRENGQGFVGQYKKTRGRGKKQVRTRFFTWSQVTGNASSLKPGALCTVFLNQRGQVKRVHFK